MKDKFCFVACGCIIIGLLIFIGLMCYFVAVVSIAGEQRGYNNGYKEACIDFYKGKLKMELVENSDGTKEWKWIEKK